MNPSQGNQSRNVAQNQTNGGLPQSFFNAGFNADGGAREFGTRLSSQQWLFSYVQTVKGTLQICQELRELGVDSDVTDQITSIVENTLRRDIPGLEPTNDEYLVEDISSAEGIQNAVTILRNFGIDVEGNFDFDQKAADDMSRKAKKQSA
jgi:hypothetical protein